MNVSGGGYRVYANTGGQASKATPIGATAQFAAGGKATPKKDLGMMLATYGYIYVAHVSLGANPEHLIKCLKEAAAHRAVHCHRLRALHQPRHRLRGMACSLTEEKLAVDCGYWPLFRYIPENRGRENPFIWIPAEPNGKLREYMMGENRFATLTRTFPRPPRSSLPRPRYSVLKVRKVQKMAEEK